MHSLGISHHAAQCRRTIPSPSISVPNHAPLSPKHNINSKQNKTNKKTILLLHFSHLSNTSKSCPSVIGVVVHHTAHCLIQ